MIYINDLQKNTLLLVDDMINKNKDFEYIARKLAENNYSLKINGKNINRLYIYKMEKRGNTILNEIYTFVNLVKKKNCVIWETVNLH